MKNPVITAALLAKYDRPGPRYTSYPTAPIWRADFGAPEYGQALAAGAESPETPLSLYVHIPFCRQRCAYCGCNTVTDAAPKTVSRYLDAMHREIEMVAQRLGQRKSVTQLHWGGGTPTFLSEQQMRALFAALSSAFSLRSDAEIAVETNPHTISDAQLACLSALGFNRISFGVQDLNPAVQHAVGRDQNVEETARIITRARDLGFRGVNVDLIYGLPLQEPEAWRETMQRVVDMAPDRVAVYSYAHLPQRFAHQRVMDGLRIPGAAEKLTLFAQARQQLLDAGYAPIGMDHFARPEDELARALDTGTLSRNFMGYTVKAAPDQIGFGVSAISEVADCYGQNTKSLDDYADRLSTGRFATELGMKLSKDDCMRRRLIRQLMCTFQINVEELEHLFQIDFDAYFEKETVLLEAYQDEGMMEKRGQHWQATPLGAVFIRNICMVFDVYLRDEQRALYSRTI